MADLSGVLSLWQLLWTTGKIFAAMFIVFAIYRFVMYLGPEQFLDV